VVAGRTCQALNASANHKVHGGQRTRCTTCCLLEGDPEGMVEHMRTTNKLGRNVTAVTTR